MQSLFACMRARASSFVSLGFYVIAPKKQIEKDLFTKLLEKNSIREKIKNRIIQYKDDEANYEKLLEFQADYINPLIEKIDVKANSYEDILNRMKIDPLEKSKITSFYSQCLKYNGLNSQE